MKTESKKKTHRNRSKGEWLTEDGVYAAEGWTPESQNTEAGIRAFHRAKCIVDQCKKMNSKEYVRPHRQHGEAMYKRLSETEETNRDHEQGMTTQLSKKGRMEDAEEEKGMTSASEDSSKSSDSDSDSDNESSEGENKLAPEEIAIGSSVASSVASSLGTCMSLKEKLKRYNAKELLWLKPWAGQLEKAEVQLDTSQSSLLKGMNEKRSDKESEEKAEAAIKEANSLIAIIAPIYESMEAAKSKLGQD